MLGRLQHALICLWVSKNSDVDFIPVPVARQSGRFLDKPRGMY